MSEWQPIETAPKDGCMFDGWNGKRVADIFWDMPTNSENGRYAWCIYEYGLDASWRRAEIKGLTHWMPLPPPPTETPNYVMPQFKDVQDMVNALSIRKGEKE